MSPPSPVHRFIFRGRRGDTIKIMWADADGLCLFTKRLEEGQFIWPAVRDGKVSITRSQLAMLLEYCEHLPLYRQSEIFAHQGVELSRALLSNWVDACCQLMTPLNDVLYVIERIQDWSANRVRDLLPWKVALTSQ